MDGPCSALRAASGQREEHNHHKNYTIAASGNLHRFFLVHRVPIPRLSFSFHRNILTLSYPCMCGHRWCLSPEFAHKWKWEIPLSSFSCSAVNGQERVPIILEPMDAIKEWKNELKGMSIDNFHAINWIETAWKSEKDGKFSCVLFKSEENGVHEMGRFFVFGLFSRSMVPWISEGDRANRGTAERMRHDENDVEEETH